MATKLERVIGELRDEDVLTVGTIRHLIQTDTSGESVTVRWISLAEASHVTGVPESTLRRRAAMWQEMKEPPVQVRKRGNRPASPWEFRRADCYAYAPAGDDVEPAAEPEPDPYVDEKAELLSRYAKKATDHL